MATVTCAGLGPQLGLGSAPLSMKSWSRPKAGAGSQHAESRPWQRSWRLRGPTGKGEHAQGAGPSWHHSRVSGLQPSDRVQQGDTQKRRPGAASPAAARPSSGTDRLNLVPWTPAPTRTEPEGLGLVHLTGLSILYLELIVRYFTNTWLFL